MENTTMMPTKYETERIQLITIMAYNIFDGTVESVEFAMRDLAIFHKTYEEAMQEASESIKHLDDPVSKEIDELRLPALGFNGLHLLLEENESMIFDIANSLIKDIDIEKEFSQEIRTHVLQEMMLRSESHTEKDVA